MKTLFITGVSSGFGQALATTALAAGHRVIGTLRTEEARRAFESSHGNARGRLLDVTNFAAAEALAADVEASIGPVDVLINNAGYGHEGILEESPLSDLLSQFNVNVFGVVAVTKGFLPFFRARRRGHIVNITSMGGFITMPGIAYYCGSKFALEGISEVLSKEVAGLGIAVTAVAPGSFRTDWAGRSMVRSPRQIGDYDALFDPIRQARHEKSGQQLGDPLKAAKVILDLVDSENPPAHLILGSDALGLARNKLHQMEARMAAWESVSVSTDG
jgi:NAD(P)-dependent dehydrogenase (short-subunit alcohol dehydrogenase family)